MNWLNGDSIFSSQLEGSLHADTQIEQRSVSLTAGGIKELVGSGELDFGGSEFKLGEREPIEPQKRDSEDDYGWWSLPEGQYILELNETVRLSGHQCAIIQPHEHLYWNGASHPTLLLDEDDSDMRLMLPLTVGRNGIEIKENARVSTLYLLQEKTKN